MATSLEEYVKEKKKEGNTGTNGLFAAFQPSASKKAGLASLLQWRRSDVAPLIEDGSNDGQLPTNLNRKMSSSVCGWDDCELSRTQRFAGFLLCIFAAMMCFTLAVLLLPVLVVSTRKFAALNTLGSALLIISFAFLWGPATYFTHLMSQQKRMVSIAYASAVFATLYSSLWLRSTIFTLIASVFQGFTLIWFVLSYVPGGERGLRFFASLFTGFVTSRSTTVLPI